MNAFPAERFPAAFRARIRLFRFSRGTTLIEIAVYYHIFSGFVLMYFYSDICDVTLSVHPHRAR